MNHLFTEHKKYLNQGKPLNFDLSFGLIDLPIWRSSGPTTSQMLYSIKSTLEYVEKTDRAKKLMKLFATKMAITYVLSSNQGERVGVQNENDTFTIIDNHLKQAENDMKDIKVVETLNTFEGLKYMQECREKLLNACNTDKADEKYSIFITEDTLKDCHKILMRDLLVNGDYRKKGAMTKKDNNYHCYVDREFVSERVLGLLDYYNAVVENHYKSNNFVELFKLAAYLAFNYVNIHPFADGNGRMCRLLASFVLSFKIPFPVTFHCGNNGVTRTTYIDAIERCRHSDNAFPIDLTLLLIESCYISCIEFNEMLNTTPEKLTTRVVSFQSVIELDEKYQNNQSIKNMKSGDSFEVDNIQFIKKGRSIRDILPSLKK